MINVLELKRIKKLCFDNIAQTKIGKKELAVEFKPINENLFQVLMSNGEEFARIVIDSNFFIPTFSISWVDFTRVCDFFKEEIKVAVDGNVVKFKEATTKFKCNTFTSATNEHVNFKFDFENANKICMDNVLMLKDHGGLNCFAMSGEYLISADNNTCIVNKLKNNVGEDIYLLTQKFPQGTWYFNPNNRVIVSEDKRIACTYKKGAAKYPFKGLLDLSKQSLNNWFKVDLKEFKNAIDQCSRISEQIKIEPKSDSIIVSAKSDEFGEFRTELDVEFEHTSSKSFIKFSHKYLTILCCGGREGVLQINFDDNPSEYKLKVVNDNLVIFGMGMK